MKTVSRVWFLSLVVPVVVAAGLLPSGCASEDPAGTPGGLSQGGDTPLPPGGGGTPPGGEEDACATPDTGCACGDEEEQAPCAQKTGQEGGYVHCALGQRTCRQGVWGACEPSGQTATIPAPESLPGGLHTLGLGTSTKCVNNPCDPYCYGYTDTSVGYTPPGDFQQNAAGGPSGITLKPTGKPNIPATGFRIAPKPSVTMTVKQIPLGNYPVVDVEPQFTAELLCGNPAVSCNPPKFTIANWTLNSYQNLLIDGAGKVSVIKPVPSQTTVLGKAGGFSDSAQVKVEVKAIDAGNVPPSIVSAFEAASQNPSLPLDNFTWLYPYKNTVFPRGLTAPVAQTDLGPAGSQMTNALVKYTLRHRRPDNSVDFSWSKFVSQSGAPRYTVPQHVWQYFDETSSGQSAELVIQRASMVCADTPANCQDTIYEGKRYRFCSAGYSWAAARSQCQSMGMDLASVSNAAENSFLGAAAYGVASSAWWIGATDSVTEGAYKWSDGTPFSYAGWDPGQPDNSNNEDCAEIWNASGGWNDNNCGSSRYFICEGTNVSSCSVNQVRKEVVLPIKFSSEPMQGSVYFWEINNGRIAKIIDDGTLVQNFLAVPKSGGTDRCLACHTVSADGSTLVSQIDGGDGPGTTFATSNGAFQYERPSANQLMGVSPDGYWTIWNDQGKLSTSTSNATPANQYGKGILPYADGRMVAPAWSPDGKWIAWTRREYADNYWGWYVDFNKGDLFLTQFNDKRPMVAGSSVCSDYAYGGKTYRFCTNGQSWSSARGQCQSMGLDLASSASATENEFLRATAAAISGGSWWIGVNDTVTEGQYKWSDGTPYSYTFWNSGEPNNYNGVEDCGELLPGSGRWNDNNCANSNAYVCEGTNPSLISWDYFTNTTTLAGPSGTWDTSVYPSFSPDSNYVIYQMANAVRTRGNYGKLKLVKRDNPAAAVELTQANQATSMAASGTVSVVAGQNEIAYEPTFSPVASGGYYWSVFISNRWYGNMIHPTFGVVKPSTGSHLKDSGKKQMWVTAIPVNPSLASDPSTPAFWLPGQELNNENMRGYFAKSACKQTNSACQWDEDCCGFGNGTALCVLDQPVTPAAKRHCGSFTPGVCVTEGNSCTDSSQCCQNPASLECIQGVCIEPKPLPYFSPASFTRDYEGTCAQGTRVVWRTFSWKGVTPGDSSITVAARTGETTTELASAPDVALTELPPAQCTAGFKCGDVAQAFASVSPPRVSKLKLRVTITLNPTSDNSQPPVLSDWKQDYDCLPSE